MKKCLSCGARLFYEGVVEEPPKSVEVKSCSEPWVRERFACKLSQGGCGRGYEYSFGGTLWLITTPEGEEILFRYG